MNHRRASRLGFAIILAMLASFVTPLRTSAAAGQPVPQPIPVPEIITGMKRARLLQLRSELERDLAELRRVANAFNAKSAKEQTQVEFENVTRLRAEYVNAVSDFNQGVTAEARVMKGAIELANQSGDWTPEERRRLAEAVARLDVEFDPNSRPPAQAWRAILARPDDVAAASGTTNPSLLPLASAGRQSFQDCAIFALANASGTPYGVVATRAAALIRAATWRPDSERANPQGTIERKGLNGGEVAFLAEALGQVEVVDRNDFPRVLAEGRPIMLNVVPRGRGDGHQIALARTFQHRGQTWFEAVDSNQGAWRRLFLTEDELGSIQQEKGIAYRPEPNTTPLAP